VTNAPRSLFARAGAVGRRTAVGAAVVAATLALVAAPAMAAGPTAYRNIPSTIAGNIGSIAFQARSISEFGDLIQLGGTERSSAKLPVTVVMSIWACETGGDVTCDTTPGAAWNQDLTLTIYAADTTGAVPVAVVPALLTKTQSFALPYRPSRDATGHCDASGFYPWYSVAENTCFNGLAHPVTFSLPAGVTLPDQLIWSISFNTETHGYAPIGKSGPWNSLNVAAKTYSGEPTVGTDVEPQAAFVNSTWNGAYGDNGAGGLGTFRYDPTGWAAIAPLVCFGYCPINSAAATPTPFDSVLAATAPPTGTHSPSRGDSSPLLAVLICFASGALGLAAVRSQRAVIRRRL